jgi:hypothetical protein
MARHQDKGVSEMTHDPSIYAEPSAGQTIPQDPLTFLRWLYGDEAPGWLTIWTLPDKATAWFPADHLQEASIYAAERAATHDVYFGVGLRQRKLDKGRGTASDVIAIPGLWIDMVVYSNRAANSHWLQTRYDQPIDHLSGGADDGPLADFSWQ